MKVNLLSNLVLSVYPGSSPSTRQEIEYIFGAAIACTHRVALLGRSADFKPEKLRLKKMLADAKVLKFDKSPLASLLGEFLATPEASNSNQAHN